MDNRGKQLEELLTVAFNSLKDAEDLTEGKIDLEFLLTIVGSYITAKEAGDLDTEHKTPTELFDERIFPIVDNSELREEEIEDGDGTDDEVVGGDVS